VKSAIVTGGGSGIGRAVALHLASGGWSVMIAGRREQCLKAVCAESGGDMGYVVCDITEEAAVKALFDGAMETWGRIDLLFNNAGLMPPQKPVSDLSLQEWRGVMEVNVTGSFLCAREAFKCMATQQPQGGRIINNGSVSAHVPRPNSTPYTVSKHAITGLTRSLSLEGRAFNIACGQIDIGNTSTDITTSISSGAIQADGRIMAEAMMDMENVVRSVAHMASLPLDANVQFMTVMATQMPYIGRG